MKCFDAIGSGFTRTIRAWRAVFASWLIYLALASVLVFPLKAQINNALKNSTVTERLADGIDTEILNDILNNYSDIPSFFFSVLFFLIIFIILLNAFLTGGIFSSVRKEQGTILLPDLFRASSIFFLKFAGLTILISLISVFAFFFLFLLPVTLISSLNDSPDKAGYISAFIFGGFFVLVLGVLALVADYSRAALVSEKRVTFSGALGFGFSETFSNFLPSLILILLLILFQLVFTAIVLWFVGLWRPASSAGAFLLFVVSQLLFSLRIFIKCVRYASVTALMDINSIDRSTIDQTIQSSQQL